MNTRPFFAWLIGVPFSYFIVGFLGKSYSFDHEIIPPVIFLHSCLSIYLYHVLGRAKAQLHFNPIDFGMMITLFGILSGFTLVIFKMAEDFPGLFSPVFKYLTANQLIMFVVALGISLPLSSWILSHISNGRFRHSIIVRLIDQNLAGLILAGFLFSTYLILVSIFNQPAFDVDDIFFDADSNLWRWRFATPDYRDYYWRSVHPFVLIIIRPLVALIAFFLKGDKLQATFVLVAFMGALCVFLVWYFVKHVVGNSLYALLIASVFGASAAQLVFSSLIETYIFLAATVLVFLILLLKDKPLFLLVITGLVAFGITISNFGQTVIAHLLIKRDIKRWVKYGLIVAVLVVPLTLLNNFVYPNSQPYFFDLSSYESEGHNSFPPSVQRGVYLARVMFLHSIVAPEPLILKEEIPFLKVWMFRASIKKDPMRLAEYTNWFGTSVAMIWFSLMLVGGLLFLKNLRKQDYHFQFTLILILLFNFVLHLRYGKDVFLYSTNWTYAVILFLALAWEELANKRWFQISLLVFVALLLVNNSQLIYTMLSVSALHIK